MEKPEPPLRELSAFTGATRSARSRKERIDMTPADPIPTPVTPEPLSAEELDELGGEMILAKRTWTLEQIRSAANEAAKSDGWCYDCHAPVRSGEGHADDCHGGAVQSMLHAFADLLEARTARPSPWQKVTRVEVIAERGRAFTRWDCHLEHTDSMFQDDGRTLKLFVKDGTPTSPPAQGRRTAAVNDLPSIEEMAGSVSDVTGGQTLEEFMRWLRDE